MTDVIEMIDPVTGEIVDERQFAEQLLKEAKEQGVDLVGPDGVLNGLTKRVRETAFEAEMTRSLGTGMGRSSRRASRSGSGG